MRTSIAVPNKSHFAYFYLQLIDAFVGNPSQQEGEATKMTYIPVASWPGG